MDSRIREAIFKEVAKEPFAQKFGMKLTALDEGYSRVEMSFTRDTENMFGIAHGGTIFAIIDEAFEIASNSHGTVALALSMNITYVSTPSSGCKLIAEAKEFSLTTKTAGYEIKVFDEGGKLIASCQGLVYRTGKPLPFLDK
ncbi:MAG: hotdog fold thioesterase [Syntrophaceae bacterium]|nr:hotdog fold thioesterase [Syntrophaceae bacterium]